ncbi:MAG: tetratricopeptide repeat protein [Acidobacteriota bacterium]
MKLKNTSPTLRRSKLVGAALVLAFVALWSATPALAQNGDVEIEVTDVNGKKLPDVQVTVTKEGTDVNIKAVSNKRGKVKLTIPNPQGEYNFTFEGDGLATNTVSYPIEPGKATTSIKLVDQATKDKADAVDSFNQAVGLIQGGKEEEALALFEKARSLDSSLADAHRLVAIIQAGRGNIDEAEAALNIFLEMNPAGMMQAAPAAYDVFRARGDARLDEVRGMLQQIGIAPDYAIKVFNEGVAATKAEDKAKAMALFQEAAALNPKLKNTYQSMAALEFNDEKYEAAIPHLKQLVEIDPQHAEGHKLLFFSYMNTGNEAEAAKIAPAWGAIAPNAADEILEQAKTKFKADDTAGAKTLLDMILGMSPDHPDGTLTMGMLYARTGKTAEAKATLGRFLELAPDHPEAEAARQMIAGL